MTIRHRSKALYFAAVICLSYFSAPDVQASWVASCQKYTTWTYAEFHKFALAFHRSLTEILRVKKCTILTIFDHVSFVSLSFRTVAVHLKSKTKV